MQNHKQNSISRKLKDNHSKFIILGAGMAGLGAGIALQKFGEKSLILEKENVPGGLCQTQTINGCDFDYGPKILLLNNSENSQEILSFLEGNHEKYPVEESVYLSKYGLVRFPLQRYLIDLPKEERKKILDDLNFAHEHQREVTSFKDWLINSFGKYFCELILFPYEEKKWQVSLDEMDYHWALERPIKVDKEEILKGSQENLPPNRWYYYPKHGNITALSLPMAQKAGPIEFNRKVESIDLEEKSIKVGDKKYYYDYLISSLPLDYIVKIVTPFPEELKEKSKKHLNRLGIVVINLVFQGDYDLEGTAIYFPEKEYILRRVSILQNLCPALKRKGKTQISVEVSVNPTKKVKKDDLLKLVLDNFAKIGQFAQLGSPIAFEFFDIEFAYPLQVNGLSEHVSKIHEYLASRNVYHCGRGGNFDYCNLDLAYKQGKEVIQGIL